VDARERTLVACATVAHSLNHAYILLIPLFIRIWIEEFQADAYTMGLVASSAYVFFGGGSVPFGYLADRIGSKSLLMLYLGGAAVSLLLISWSSGLLQLAVALALLGLFSSTYHPSAIAMISREVREQGKGLGYHGMGGSLGIALGPLIASLLTLAVDWRTVFLLFSAPAVILLVAIALRGPVELAPRSAPSLPVALRSFANYSFLLVLLVYIFAGIAYWGALTFLPLYLDTLELPSLSLGPRMMSPAAYMFPALLALGAAGQVAGGHLADRSRVEVILAASSALVATALLLLALPQSLAVAAVAMAFGFLLFSLEPMQNVLVSTRTSEGLRGLAFGLVFLSVFGIGAMGAVLGGFMSRIAGLSAIFPVLSLFMVASGIAALLLRQKPSAPSARKLLKER
jgi:MFS family permease